MQANYAYNAAGDLSTVDYSDATPDVTIQYDRAGRPKSMTDAAGTRTLSYHTSGQLQDELYVSGLMNGLSVVRDFDALSRLGSVSALSGSSVLTQTGFSYDAASRLSVVSQGTNSATYGYLGNSPLVERVTFKNGATTRLTTTKGYDNLNRLAGITNTPSASSALSAFYHYNAANQRTKLTRENNAYWQYSYDPLGQVTGARKHLASGTPVNGLDHAWTFDDIGNRKTATTNGQVSTYAPNMLNQYSSRSVPGSFDVFGEAKSDATVTVTLGTGLPQAVTRQGDFYSKQLAVDNSSLATGTSLKVTGVKNLVGPAGEDAVTELTRFAFTPKTPEVFAHDADGNLTADARWSYSWDGENRLLSVESTASSITAGLSKQRIEFAYDSQGRRSAKNVYAWNGAAWELGTSTRFLYDGWNLIAEMEANPLSPLTFTLTRSYVWGLDMSGSLQGAGGVGGLLFANSHLPSANSAAYAAAFDGNGNVIAYVDLATGAKSATYEYGAFGETIIADGPLQDAFAFRFSTKYTDVETGLLYYGLRYYSPSTGRWLGRDVIEEGDGPNIIAFLSNNGLNQVDKDGSNGWSMGIKWALGLEKTRTYGPNDYATGEVSRGMIARRVREKVKRELIAYCDNRRSGQLVVQIDVGLRDVSPWAYPALFVAELLTNNTAAFVGSITTGTVTATNVDCCSRHADTYWNAINYVSAPSGTKAPPKEGVPYEQRPSLIGENPFGEDGPMHTVKQTFNWNERLSF